MRHPLHRRVRVVEKKLAREKASGQAFKEAKLIEIDPRLWNRERLETLIHEHKHILFPEMSEYQVRRLAREMSDLVWEDGYRRIYA